MVSNVAGDSRTELDLDKPNRPAAPPKQPSKVAPVPQEAAPREAEPRYKRYEAPTD